jgi:hypothetical protein
MSTEGLGYHAMADHIEAGHRLIATITENSAEHPEQVTTRTERVIEVEPGTGPGSWATPRVRTASGWHDVVESSQMGPRVRFTDHSYYRLFKRVVVSVEEQEGNT